MIDEDLFPPLLANMVDGMAWCEPCDECRSDEMTVVVDGRNRFLACRRCNPDKNLQAPGVLGVCPLCQRMFPLQIERWRYEHWWHSRSECECGFILCSDCFDDHVVTCARCPEQLCIDNTAFPHPAGADDDGDPRYVCFACLADRPKCPATPSLYTGKEGSNYSTWD